MQLSIIIVSYNTKDLTLDCLHSLTSYPVNQLSCEIIVVDNASNDDTVSAIRKQFPEVKIIESPENLGFGQANNLGAVKAQGEYLLFLNSDTIANPQTLPAILEIITNKKPDLASFKLLNSDGSIQPQGGALPSLTNIPLWMLNLDNLPLIRQFIKPYQNRNSKFFNHNSTVGWVAGTAMLVKKSVFDQLSGFDPNIFMYAEDLDFCWRAKEQGIEVRYFSEPSITHLGQGSGNSESAILGEYRGLVYLFQKHQPQNLHFLKFWLKVGALLRELIFGMMGKHVQKSHYQHARRLV